MQDAVWRETLVQGKFGKFFDAKLILVEENLANLPILRLKKLYNKTPAYFGTISENMHVATYYM